MAVTNRASFRNEARYQLVCAVCETPGPYQAHHVVLEQDLKRKGLRGGALYDTRNALRLCTESVSNCHARHHWRVRTVKTIELTDENIEYAFEFYGAYAADYLRRKYDDSAPDPRIAQALDARLSA